MRAGAIALVLLSHTSLWFASCAPFFNLGLLAGYFGVELFFVLSGFLIGGILLRSIEGGSRLSLIDFWRRRWLRTLPNYFLFLGVNAALFIWLTHQAPPATSYLFFGQNIIARPPSFFVESWSLAVEEWFYILLPVLFVAGLKFSRKSFARTSLVLIGSVIVAVTIARTIYVFVSHPVWLTGVRMIVIYRLDACMFGVLAAWIKHFEPGLWQRSSRLVCFAGLSLLAFVASLPFVLPGDSLVMHMLGFTLTSFGAVLLLPQLDLWRSSSSVIRAPIEKISLWSYSLYLVNLPVFAFIMQWRVPPFLSAIAFLVLSIGISAFVYRFYERPIMDLRARFASRRVDFNLGAGVPALTKN